LKLVVTGRVIDAQVKKGVVKGNETLEWKQHCKEKAFPLAWKQFGNILRNNGVQQTRTYEPTMQNRN